MANLYRLIVYGVVAVAACWLALVPLGAHAAIAPTATYYVGGQPSYGSPSEACSAYIPVYQASQSPRTATVASANPGTNGCALFYTLTAPCCGGVPAGTTGYSYYTIFTGPTTYCPANSTLTGGTCVCNSGFLEEGGACVDAAAAACEALSGQSVYVQVPGRNMPGSTVCAASGCTMTMSGTVIVGKDGGATVTEGDASFTGAACTPVPAEQAAPDPCVKGYQGEVNGVSVCVPYAPGSDVETVKTSESTSTPGVGDPTTTSTTSSTVCSGNSCNTTTTVTTTVGGGSPTTTTTETEQPRDDYCAANPRSPECTESTFSGSCGAGFTCQGDAVQCATARELHRVSCTLHAETAEAALYEAASAAIPGPADIPSSTVDIGPGALDGTNALGASACLGDLAVTVAGTAVTLPLSSICPYLAHMRLLLLAVAWLMAFRIVAKG